MAWSSVVMARGLGCWSVRPSRGANNIPSGMCYVKRIGESVARGVGDRVGALCKMWEGSLEGLEQFFLGLLRIRSGERSATRHVKVTGNSRRRAHMTARRPCRQPRRAKRRTGCETSRRSSGQTRWQASRIESGGVGQVGRWGGLMARRVDWVNETEELPQTRATSDACEGLF